MARKCQMCGAIVRLKSFQLWDGCCDSCRAPMTTVGRIEAAFQPLPTSEDVGAYFKHMDELTRIRNIRQIGWTMIPGVMAFPILFGTGIALKCIDVGYGMFMWLCVVAAGGFPVLRYLGFRCPRRHRVFAHRGTHGVRLPNWRKDTCAHCGLRALGQHDLLRFWESKRSEAETAVEPVD